MMRYYAAAIGTLALSLPVSAFVSAPSKQCMHQLHRHPPLSAAAASNVVRHASSGDYGEIAKSIVIILAFGGGLIPASIAANSEMIGTMTGKRRGGESVKGDPKTSLDPTILDSKNRKYVEDSGATGPELPNSGVLLANEKIPLVDVIAIMGRIRDVDSICDWADLPSTKRQGVSQTKPPMWLPRGAFKVNMRKQKWLGWPMDPKTGEPVGGQALKQAEERRISQRGALIGDAALDAVWDTWALGASIATPDKVGPALAVYRPNDEVLDVNKFVGSAIRGRSVTALAALTFISIQALVYSSLFIAPFLRVFFNTDIGFGNLGTCDPALCTKLY